MNPEIDISDEFSPYRFRPLDYIRERLNRTPWQSPLKGVDDQISIINAYGRTLKQLHERRDYQNGRLTLDELTVWEPGERIKNYLSIDAGHTVGKTALLAMLSSHFFDSCAPSIIYTFAPTKDQINDLLWKEIRDQRFGKGLPGTIHKIPRLSFRHNHFMVGKATNNAKGAGTERAQGQHNPYILIVVDEAEGMPAFIWDAIRSIDSGGIVIVLVARNPRTRHSQAHKLRTKSTTQSFRIDCATHPNVIYDRPIYEGMVERRYVDDMLDDYCQVVPAHNAENMTFEISWKPGLIYEPGIEYLWRVMGYPGGSQSDNTICSYGVYNAAKTAVPPKNAPSHIAWLGIDAARYGDDSGTLYARHNGRIWRARKFQKQDGYEYYLATKSLCEQLDKEGVTEIYVRVDAGGGYASTVTDNLNRDLYLQQKFDVFEIIEVNFNRRQYDDTMFGDFITELYWWGGSILKSYQLVDPPPELEIDLTERTYRYMRSRSLDGSFYDVKVLTYKKERFKKLFGHSPDDGDGFCLAAAPALILQFPEQTFYKTTHVKTAVHRR